MNLNIFLMRLRSRLVAALHQSESYAVHCRRQQKANPFMTHLIVFYPRSLKDAPYPRKGCITIKSVGPSPGVRLRLADFQSGHHTWEGRWMSKSRGTFSSAANIASRRILQALRRQQRKYSTDRGSLHAPWTISCPRRGARYAARIFKNCGSNSH